MVENNNFRHENRKRTAMVDEDLLEYLKKKMGEQVVGERVTVLYGSDTGNAENVAKNFQFEMKRRGLKAKCYSFNEIDINDLQDESKILAVVSTAGQGDMPKSAVKFWEATEPWLEGAPADFLKDTKFAVFGMGDSSYVKFNEAAKQIDNMFERLGAQRLQECGMGDDQHPARYDTVLEDWGPDFFDNIEAPPPPQELGAPSHLVELVDPQDVATMHAIVETIAPHHSKPITLRVKR